MFANFMAAPALFGPSTLLGGLGVADTALDPEPADAGGVGPEPTALARRAGVVNGDDVWLRQRFLTVETRYGTTVATQMLVALYGEDRYTGLRNLTIQLLDQLRSASGANMASVKETLRGVYRRREEIENELLSRVLSTQPAKLGVNVGSRDVDGRGGWVYTQRANGSILVARDPRPGAPLQGRALSGSAKAAVLREIGPFPGGAARPVGAVAPSAAQLTSARTRAVVAVAADTAPDAEERAVEAADARHPGQVAVKVLYTAAGIALATGNPLLAVGASTAAGMIKLVMWARKKKANKRAFEARAKQLDTPFADEYPRLFAKALQWSPAEREAFVAKAKKRAKRRWSERRQDRLLHQAALVEVLDLTLKAEARGKLRAVGEDEPSDAAVAGFSGYAGLADLGGLGLETVSAGDLAPALLGPRLITADAGDYSAGGVRLPREACAFVAGYLRNRYIPTMKRVMPVETRAKLEALAAQFSAAAGAGSEEAAARQALAIGVSNIALNTIARAFGEINARLASMVAADGLRVWAGQVLRHAAACLTVLGAPLASTRVFLALTGDTSTAAAVEAAVAAATASASLATGAGLVRAAEAGTPAPNAAVSMRSAVAAADSVVAIQSVKAEDAAQRVAAAAAPIPVLRDAAARLTAASTPAEAQAAAEALRAEAAAVGARGPAEAAAAASVVAAVGGATRETRQLARVSGAAKKVRAAAAKLRVSVPASMPGVCDLTPQGSVARFVCQHPWLTALVGVVVVGGLLFWQKERVVGVARNVAGRVRGAAAELPGPAGFVARSLGDGAGSEEPEGELDGLEDYAEPEPAPKARKARKEPLPKPPAIEFHGADDEDEAEDEAPAPRRRRSMKEAAAMLDGVGFA